MWGNEWGADIFFSHGSTHSRGVCILINPSIVSIDLRTDTASISLCNIYAPNDLQKQLDFFTQFGYICGIQYGYWKPHYRW